MKSFEDSSSISAIWVKRPITGIMVFAALALLGFTSLARLKLDLMPAVEFPIVAIVTTYDGASPETIEELITKPIEQAMASVQSVEKLSSSSRQGNSMVMVNFAWGTDMNAAESEVRKNIELFADPHIPGDASNPLVFAFDPSMQPIMFMSVNAPGTPDKVKRLAEDAVAPSLSRIDGVAAAEVMGGIEREIQVRVQPDWLQAYGIAAHQVVGALRASNVMIPGGNLEQGNLEINISTDAMFSSVTEIEDVVVGQRNGSPVHVRDIANVRDTFEEASHMVRANGLPAVMLQVRKQSDANTVQVVRRIRAELRKLEERLPEEVELGVVFDQGDPVERSLSNLASTALMALAMTGIVLLFFLRGFRSSSIVLIGIPLATLITFTSMDALGVTLNMISMAGLALAVGMLVDNAIVVLENIFKKVEEGFGPHRAAVIGTQEMAMPITASTLTTVSVFAPVLFVPGLAGQLFRDMSLTICISLAASLLVALTLVPLLASLMLKQNKASRFEAWLGRMTGWVDPLSEAYGKFLGRALKRSGLVLLVALLVFVSTMGLATTLGADFLPVNDFGMVEFSFEAAPGTSIGTTADLVSDIEEVVREVVPEFEVVAAEWGGGDAFAAIFGATSHSGMIRARLPARSKRDRSQKEIERELRKRFQDVPGVEMKSGNAAQAAALGVGAGDVVVKVFTQDLQQLREYGQRLALQIEAVEGATDVSFSLQEGVPELKIDLDRTQIRELGLRPAQVAQTVSTYFMGTTATLYREKGEEIKVTVRASRNVREDIDALRSLPMMTPAGVSVPLSTVATIRPALGPTSIARENQRRVGSIGVNADGVALGTLVTRIGEVLDEVERDRNITVSVAGSAEDLAESFQALGYAFLAAFLLVYMVMASQFESLLEPFVILGAIPFALSGVVIGLLVTGTTIQVTALIGVILLTGIVVNNGIVLIDVLKNRRLEGMNLIEASVEAGRLRLRPILMTTLTTVLGMVPLALGLGDGGETWAPMARAVIGGLSFSTLLTLIVVPAAYVKLAGIVDRRKARKGVSVIVGSL